MDSDPVKSKRQHNHIYTVPVIHIRAVELEVFFLLLAIFTTVIQNRQTIWGGRLDVQSGNFCTFSAFISNDSD